MSMHRLQNSVLHLARFTLEAQSALSIGSGANDGVYDHPIVRDANGLPMIPGTSLAGVLRHLWIANHGGKEAAANALFGYQRYDKGDASRLEVAACPMQNSHGQAVEGLVVKQHGLDDPLLKAAQATRDDPLFRDRVRISHRGVAADTGKFDRGLVLAGTRFCGELRLWSDKTADPDWEALLALLVDPRLRLGGATRAGLGAMRLVPESLHCGTFNLRQPEDVRRLQTLAPSLGAHQGLTPTTVKHQPITALTTLRLRLTPRDFWRIGQGDGAVNHYDKTPNLLPKTEAKVTWEQHNKGKINHQIKYALVPGSAVKGALAHRTAFHFNALSGIFVEDIEESKRATWDKSEDSEAVRALFGFAKNKETAPQRSRAQTGQAGQVFIDDLHLKLDRPKQQATSLMHNSIDRFTGGVRNRMLFSEEVLYNTPMELTITLLPGVATTDDTTRQALARALVDLCAGRLALGGGATKGHGSFSGEPLDADTRTWLIEQGEQWPCN